jgi:imidazolonepropionase-like amidohydrolase
LFDGRAVKKRQGVLFGTDRIEWVGAHARAPKSAGSARDVHGIEAGARADLLLVDGDPTEDPRSLLGRRVVWQAGRPV